MEPFLPDLMPLLDFEMNPCKTKMQVSLKRLDSGKYSLVSSELNGFQTIIYVNDHLWMNDLVILNDGDVIEISHFRDRLFQYHPLIVLEGLFYFCSSVCSKNSKRMILNWSISS